MEKYKDIINLKNPTSKKYPRMSIEKRAAQFSPFAALTGFEEKIIETKRLTQTKIDLTDEYKLILNEKIIEKYKNKVKTTITYFIKDKLKKGGKYIEEKGVIKKIDDNNKQIILENNKKISIIDIIDID